ncbi:MAG TPA: polyprenyl synthetase family protein [Thermomicrobiales bacterium]|nr:polyprenyl synthetase family protein [Thermomicrobiales bacterium]
MKRRFDAPLEAELHAAVGQIDGFAPLLGKMVRFHLGWIETDGKSTPAEVRRVIQGKRVRPYLNFLTAESLGTSPAKVAPIAAAIELLHNFTLIHDDIQDRSPNRRHRATVWRVWGDAQAINAGDALFATAQRALLRMSRDLVSPTLLLRMVDAFNAMTIDIVQGQTADLEFELRNAISPEDYLAMIRGKTAAILRFSAWAGAIAAGASDDVADQMGGMGESLGLGFQIRDDILGVWGESSVTGKDQADDIRRRKKSLPILLLLDQATPEEAKRLVTLYGAEKIDEHGVAEVRGMLDTHGIEAQANAMVTGFHQEASASLASSGITSGSSGLMQLLQMLDIRTS